MRFLPLFALALLSCGGLVGGAGEGGGGPGPDTSPPPGGSATATAPPPSADPTTPCTAPDAVETVADLHVDPNLVTGRILVDASYLFVDTNRGMYRVRKCGGTSVKIADDSPGQYAASGLVAYDDALYLAAVSPVNGGFVRRIAKDGSGAVDVVTNAKELFGLGLVGSGNDARLYWVEREGGSDALREMRLADGGMKTVASLPVAYSYGPFLGDASGVTFFAQTGSNNGTFYRWSASGLASLAAYTAPVDLVSGVDGSDVYFSFGHTGANGIASLSSSSPSMPVPIAQGAAPYGVALADGFLYFTDLDSGSVMRWSHADDGSWQMTFPVTSGENDPRFVAVDEQAVYWATYRGVLRRGHR